MIRRFAIVGLAVAAVLLSGLRISPAKGSSWWTEDRMDRLDKVVDQQLASIYQRLLLLEARR